MHASGPHNIDHHRDVDKILAEGVVKGRTFFLVLWLHHALEDASWEPEENVSQKHVVSWKRETNRDGHANKVNLIIRAWRKAVVELLLDRVTRNSSRTYMHTGRGINTASFRQTLEISLAQLNEMPRVEDEEMITEALRLLKKALSESNDNIHLLVNWPSQVARAWNGLGKDSVSFKPRIIKHIIADGKGWLRNERATLLSVQQFSA